MESFDYIILPKICNNRSTSFMTLTLFHVGWGGRNLLFNNDLKYGKNFLFCFNGYYHAIFTILFYESQVKELRKSYTKEKKNFKVLMPFL